MQVTNILGSQVTAMKKIVPTIIFMVMLSPINTIWGSFNTELLEKTITENTWLQGRKNQNDFIKLIKDISNKKETEKLNIINDYVNTHIRYTSDIEAWGKIDYWATPLETFNNSSGDCEDFAIAKYFALKKLGISPTKLRLVYVQYYEPIEHKSLAHMVLSYTDNNSILILDNLINEIKPSNQRTDLKPVFSFNDEGIYTELGNSKVNKSLSKWEEVNEKIKREGW